MMGGHVLGNPEIFRQMLQTGLLMERDGKCSTAVEGVWLFWCGDCAGDVFVRQPVDAACIDKETVRKLQVICSDAFYHIYRYSDGAVPGQLFVFAV